MKKRKDPGARQEGQPGSRTTRFDTRVRDANTSNTAVVPAYSGLFPGCGRCAWEYNHLSFSTGITTLQGSADVYMYVDGTHAQSITRPGDCHTQMTDQVLSPLPANQPVSCGRRQCREPRLGALAYASDGSEGLGSRKRGGEQASRASPLLRGARLLHVGTSTTTTIASAATYMLIPGPSCQRGETG